MTAREPSAVEVIAEAMRKHHIDLDYRGPDNDTRCVCLGWVDGDDWDDHLAEAVLAAIRAMTVQQQAEVIGGGTERGWGNAGTPKPAERAYGPWREVQP